MTQHPNMILILADDMGYSDLGCYGSEIQTPSLDKLANKGLRFSQMYNSARCCPSTPGVFPRRRKGAALSKKSSRIGVRPTVAHPERSSQK